METLRKFFCFAVACVAILGAIGGTAYLFYYHQPVMAIATLCLAAMAAPYVITRVKELLK